MPLYTATLQRTNKTMETLIDFCASSFSRKPTGKRKPCPSYCHIMGLFVTGAGTVMRKKINYKDALGH